MISNKKHFIFNIISSYGNTIISSILSLISIPIALSYWGTELYGIWTILTSFSVYIAASGLGIDSAVGLLMTKNSDFKIKLAILLKGSLLLIICCIITFIAMAVIFTVNPEWYKIIGKMNEQNYLSAKISATIFIIVMLINMPFGVVSCSFAAFGYTFINTFLNAIQAITTFIIILFIINNNYILVQYVLFYGINILGISMLKTIVLVILIKKEQKLSITIIEKNEILSKNTKNIDNSFRKILKSGINLSLYGMALLFIPNISNMIISNQIDIAHVVLYSISYKLFSTTALIVISLNAAATPLMGKAFGYNNWDWIKTHYMELFYSTIILSTSITIGMIFLSKDIILLWTGNIQNYPGVAVIVFLGLYFFTAALSNLNHVIINAFNYTKNIWIITWSEALIFIVLSFFLIQKTGISGIAFSLFFSSICISSWLYPLTIYKRSGKKLKYDFKFLVKILPVYICFVISGVLFNFINIIPIIRICISLCVACIYFFIMMKILPKKKLLFDIIKSKFINKKV